MNEIPLAKTLRGVPLELSVLLPLALQLTRILVAIHQLGVFHRNINPANILLSGSQRKVMLINFNLATSVAEEQPAFIHHREIAGKLAYLAPEQTGRTGRVVDHRADLYAIGATLYELATGRTPFAHSDSLQLIHDLLARVPPPPIELNQQLPLVLSDMIMSLLQKEPDRRYQSAAGLAHDLAHLQYVLARGEVRSFELGSRDFAQQLSLPSRLIGRDAEMAELRSAFDASLTGARRGVLLAGAPGVGKTALINTLRPYVTERQGWMLYGRFDRFRQELETDAVAQVLRSLGRMLLAEPEQELLVQRERILQALGDNAVLIVAGLPEFQVLLDIKPERLQIDPVNGTAQLLQALMDLLHAIITPARPLVIVLDDLQWAASTPLNLINLLFMETRLNGLLVVAAYDDPEMNADHPLSSLLTRWQRLPVPLLNLQLRTLPQADLCVLVGEMLRLPPTRAEMLGTLVGERTGGNPYDTLEFINALRRDGQLVLGEQGWEWDAAAIRRHIGKGEVGDLLLARIQRLPLHTQELIQSMACLGGAMPLEVLRTACNLSEHFLERCLAPALEDGLLVLTHSGTHSTVGFRQPQIQHAAYASLAEAERIELHLRLARRTTNCTGQVAAEQYLQVMGVLRDRDEIRRVIHLFRHAAGYLPLVNFVAAELYLEAAIDLLSLIATAEDAPLIAALNIEWHQVLFNLGRFEEADAVYRAIERSGDPVQFVESACLQISSLANRKRVHEAVDFGFDMLQRLGAKFDRAATGIEVAQRIQGLRHWAAEDIRAEQQRPDAGDVMAIAQAKVIHRLMAPVNNIFDLNGLTCLVLEAQRLWTEHGPNQTLVGPLGHAAFVTIAQQQDYRSGYDAVRHLLALCEPRGYQPATSEIHFLLGFSVTHWFESLEVTVQHLQRGRAGLLRAGDIQNACFTYLPCMVAMLDCAPNIDACAAEIESGLAQCAKSGNDLATLPYLAHRQLLRALRDETVAPGSFDDAAFDERIYLEELGQDRFATVLFHLARGLAAAVFGDAGALVHHAAAAIPLLPRLQGMYRITLGYLLQALALAERVKNIKSANHAGAELRASLLAELDVCRDWMAARAVDCSANFLHLQQWLDAERAWALGDFHQTASAFDAALFSAAAQQRPWHQALITERAALFRLAHGLQHTGQLLLVEARRLYEAWGAIGKVRQLNNTHACLQGIAGTKPNKRSVAETSVDSIDMHAILLASQTLSSETSLPRLQARLIELLSAMTGATQVQLVLRREEPAAWMLSSSDSSVASIAVDEPHAHHLLPLSAFHYTARTLEPLLVEDAVRDERFMHDPYVTELDCCSLLLVPILSKGKPRAMLIIENRLSRGAFSVQRLDAVKLVAGQFAVSLENALLYQELEQRVAERTAELARSVSLFTATLESTADGISAVSSSGEVICANRRVQEMWNIPADIRSSREHREEVVAHIAAQLQDPDYYRRRNAEMYAHPEEDHFDVFELQDGRVIERYTKPQKIDGQTVGTVINFRDITERRRSEEELKATHRKLMDTSRQAGMAEVASNVLHNVGNVLNSVNVSANLVAENMKRSKLDTLAKVSALLQAQTDLGDFINNDPKGRQLPGFIAQLSEHLANDRQMIVQELESLRSNIDHIKEIVAMQQNYSKVCGLKEIINVVDLVEDALRMHSGALQHHEIEVVREFEAVPLLNTEKHNILQILVNLVGNARRACSDSDQPHKRLILRVRHEDDLIKIAVIDNGVGISAENLTRIFGHGFTTRKDGHGFGLHSGALAAHELGGALRVNSDGEGLGATFTLELPVIRGDFTHA
ncbi:MAG: AAA family ATPase [Steroidobacteraceae bacterium]